MDEKELKRIQREALVERLVGSTNVPLKFVANTLKVMQDMLAEYKKLQADIAKRDALFASFIAETQRISRIVGEPGKPGKDGEDGKTPDINEVAQLAATFVTVPKAKDIARLAAALIPAPKPAKDGKDAVVDYDKAVQMLLDKLIKEKLLTPDHINGFRTEMDIYRSQLAGKIYGKNTSVRGGGDTVKAGTNVIITTDASGNKVINAQGGSGGATIATQYQLTAVQAGSDVTIDLTQLTNWATFSSLVQVQRNNIPQTETINFTLSGSTLTVKDADASEIFNVMYAYT